MCSICNAWLWHSEEPINIERIYDESYFSGTEYIHYPSSMLSQKKNFMRKIKILEKTLEKEIINLKILEIGSATGIFLDCLREVGCKNYFGIEVSEYARSVTQSKGHICYSAFDENLNELIKIFSPDLICAWDVWEHLENPSDIFMTYMNRKNCFIALTTVDASSKTAQTRKADWRQFHPPSHINYPTRKSFQQFFQNNSGEVLFQESFGMYRPLGEYLGAVGLKKLMLKLMPKMTIFSTPIFLDLKDIQFIIAKVATNRSA
jgi:2-polyprenyl-3-methyl-5-hydroxy-6-metoxy-1,4-benzoquinol methylase